MGRYRSYKKNILRLEAHTHTICHIRHFEDTRGFTERVAETFLRFSTLYTHNGNIDVPKPTAVHAQHVNIHINIHVNIHDCTCTCRCSCTYNAIPGTQAVLFTSHSTFKTGV